MTPFDGASRSGEGPEIRPRFIAGRRRRFGHMSGPWSCRLRGSRVFGFVTRTLGRLRDPTGRHYDRSAGSLLDWDSEMRRRRSRVPGSADPGPVRRTRSAFAKPHVERRKAWCPIARTPPRIASADITRCACRRSAPLTWLKGCKLPPHDRRARAFTKNREGGALRFAIGITNGASNSNTLSPCGRGWRAERAG